MTSSKPTLKKLLQEPFGPYWHNDILDQEKCKSTPTNVLTLSKVMLACGDKPIGLTYTEATQPECDDERLAQARVLARGVLKITSYSWLSETGRKALQEDLNQRHTHLMISGDVPKADRLTLERLYNMHNQRQGPTGLAVKVLIQGMQQKPAAYMTSDVVPDGLEVYWEHDDHSHRAFKVLSLDVETYMLSRRYLARYHLLRTMRDLITIYKEEMGVEHVAPESLTPEWYVTQYLEHKASGHWLQTHRVIHDSDVDTDVEPDTSGTLKKGRTHKPRHVSSAEVRSLFLMHAPWLIHDQKQIRRSRTRVIDVKSWTRWLAKGRTWRAAALEEHPDLHFGMFDSEDEDEGADIDDMSIDSDEEEGPPEVPIAPPQPLRKGPNKRKEAPPPAFKTTSKKVRKGRARIDSSASSSHSGPSRSVRPEVLLPPVTYTKSAVVDDHSSDRSYDSDFSDREPSTPPWSDSDDSLPSGVQTPVSPTLMARIPAELLHPPELPWPGLTWYCPIKSCDYEIDLLSLTKEQSNSLSVEDVIYMTTFEWSLADELLQQIFMDLTDYHNRWHLDAEGIELVEDENGEARTLKWKTPEAHLGASHASKHARGGGSRNVVVKEEVGE